MGDVIVFAATMAAAKFVARSAQTATADRFPMRHAMTATDTAPTAPHPATTNPPTIAMPASDESFSGDAA
jgi:hypothetical protein